MSDKLKKNSPWDVESSSPPPPPRAAGTPKNMWANRPIVEAGHARDLDASAAINEFGMKMPRDKAEDLAYNQYMTRHRTEAAAHHLRQSQVARAAGDLESAAKHGMMYNLHAKAIGHDPAIGAHPEISRIMQEGAPPGNYKFKPHKADTFAVAEHAMSKLGPVVSSAPAPALGKSEKQSLYVLYKAAEAILTKVKVKPCWCKAYGHPHRTGGGMCKEKDAKGKEVEVKDVKG